MIEYVHEIIILITAVVFTFVGYLFASYNKQEPFNNDTIIRHGIKAPKNEPIRDEGANIPKWADS